MEGVEFAASVPPRLKLKELRKKKYLVKTAMEGRLPHEILWRKKAAFMVPNGTWIKGEMQQYVQDTLSPDRIRAMTVLNAKTVGGMLQDHFANRADNSFQIWCLLTLTEWFRQFKPVV